MNYQHTQLHGFHIASCEMPHIESVSAGFFIPVGSRFESAPINGSAHFAEHMIFKGTASRNALQLAIDIEGSGGAINAYTTEDQTCLETRGPADALPHFLEVMSQMLWHSTFPHDEVEREREVIAEEIVMYHENPSDHLHDLLSLALWPDHPLGRPITGTEASILGINRDSLIDFTKHAYTTQGLTLAVAGNISHQEVLSLAERFLPKASSPPLDYTPWSPPATDTVGQPPLLHDQRQIEQSHLALGFHTSGRHSEHRHVLRMLSLLLGETMSSRLFQELREKRGLCYHIATDFSLYEDTGTFEIHAALDSDRLEESIRAIQSVLHKVIKHGFYPEELEQAKRFADGQARIGLETPQAQMSWMGDSLTSFGKIIDPDEARQLIESVTLDQAQAFAQATFHPSKLAIASIGPQSESQMQDYLQHLTLDA